MRIPGILIDCQNKIKWAAIRFVGSSRNINLIASEIRITESKTIYIYLTL